MSNRSWTLESHIQPLWKVSVWYTAVALSYFENVKVKAIDSIDEVQSAGGDRDCERVIKDFTVQLPFEQLGFPGLLQTSGHLGQKMIQRI